MDSRIFWGSNCGILRLVEEVVCSALIAPGAHINFAAKRKNGWNHLAMAQPSLFFPLFGFLISKAASGFMVHERATGEASPDVFSCQLLLHGKEEFARNALQNGGYRHGSQPLQQ